ncbi:hypothetical protein [Mesorhizobium sp.]|jgi:hypothetical protein|uniref:hypothetical protein n=1 Tax=Mesorhizobium sp. TaxID=1871066 RepID=UPI003567A05C
MSVWTWDGWKRNAPAVILFIGAFVIVAMLASSRWANDATPIRSVNAIDGTVKSAQWSRGNSIDYVVDLHDGSSVLIEDTRLHVIGSDVAIERVTRDNGFVFHRFPE